ncbi:MAG: hypothetical protein J7L82_07380, partial [Staphylothermus sp.]|nr:hypothetical protein [Staphylothermus sp.]
RSKYKLKELSERLNIDIPTLSKFSTGQLFPSIKRINKLKRILLELVNPLEELRLTLTSGSFSYPELNNILNTKPYLLTWASIQTAKSLKNIKFDIIFSIEGGGLAYSSLVSLLTGKPIVYAIRGVHIEGGVIEPFRMLGSGDLSPRFKTYLTVPKKGIYKGNRVVIMDDISWTGNTIYTLYNIAIKYGASVNGIYLLVTTNDVYQKLVKTLKTDVKVLLII